ncbi:MAG: hypothetical protein PHG35_07380 [Dehalococcoidales bacterium]|nr:hypothetical protein [Dehalococcoidales bacterium]
MKLNEKGIEKHPAQTIIVSNLAMGAWIALGTVSCWFLHPIAAWVYLAVALLLVGVVLRKLVCTNCYYYNRWCGTGWGKLSALMFKEGEMEKFSRSVGVKIAPPTYGLLSLVPLVLLIIALVQEFTIPKIVVMVLLLLISAYSAFLSRRKGCQNCKMSTVCPGSVS